MKTYLKVDKKNIVRQTKLKPFKKSSKEKGFDYYEVDFAVLSGDSYDGTTYKKQIDPIDWPARKHAWIKARNDLVGDDTKNIKIGDKRWKNCVMYNHFDGMTNSCWPDIINEYPI